MDTTKQQPGEATFDRLLLLLTTTPRPGFERFFEELTRREVERLMPLPADDCQDSGDE